MLRRASKDAAAAAAATVLLAAALAVSSACCASAQETGALLGLLADPPPERAAAPEIDTRAFTIDEAVVVSGRLADDVLVLTRIVALQERLLETNATRAAVGSPPLLLPRRICHASPLRPMCGRLEHTFAPGESP